MDKGSRGKGERERKRLIKKREKQRYKEREEKRMKKRSPVLVLISVQLKESQSWFQGVDPSCGHPVQGPGGFSHPHGQSLSSP